MAAKKTTKTTKKIKKNSSAKRGGGGSKLSRTEIVQVRLDPKLRYAAELAAKKHRRTLSSYIEWAIAESVENVKVGNKENETAAYVANAIWDKSKLRTLFGLVKKYPNLVTYDEEALWNVFADTQIYWAPYYENYKSLSADNPPGALRIPEKLFNQFLECAKGKLEITELIGLIGKTIKNLPKNEAKEHSRRKR